MCVTMNGEEKNDGFMTVTQNLPSPSYDKIVVQAKIT